MNIKDLQPGSYKVTSSSQPTASDAYSAMVNNVQGGSIQAPPAPSKSSNIAGDFLHPLTVAGTRIGQAIADPLVQEKINSTTDIQNEQTDSLNKVLAQIKTEQDPTKKQNLINQAHTLVSQAASNTQAGQDAVNSQNQISDKEEVTTPGLGTTEVEGQRGGKTGAKQIAGQALEDASYIAAPEAVGGEGEAASLAEKALKGAATGAAVGGGGGAGQEMQQPDSTAGQIVKAGAEGAATGAAVGGAIPVATEGIKTGSEALDNLANETKNSNAIDTGQIASNAIKNPADMEQAFKEGRITLEDGKNVIQPSKGQQSIIDTLKPLAEKGNVAGTLEDVTASGNKGVEAQLNNRSVVQQELEDESGKLRGALQGWDETDRLNAQKTKDFLANASPTEKASFYKSMGGEANVKEALSPSSWKLKDFRGEMESIKLPDPVKNEPTLARNASSLQDAASQLAKKVGRNSEDLLDLRQNFDDYVKQNYGKGFFEKGRSADPWHEYVYSMRDKINDLASARLPDGKLPDGTTFKESMLKQHNLINARDEMAAKYAREVPENSTTFTRWEKSNPTKSMLLRRIGLREGIGIGAGALGLAGAGAFLHKELSGK